MNDLTRGAESDSAFDGVSEEMLSARVQWLKAHTLFQTLSADRLAMIAQNLTEQSFAEHRRLVLEETAPKALYILRSGSLESYRSRKASPANITTLSAGAVLHLQALLLETDVPKTVISLSDCVLWVLESSVFQQLIREVSGLKAELSNLLAVALEDMSEQLAYEQERQKALRPYLVTRVKRGVVGGSRYAMRLRQNIREVTQAEPQPDSDTESQSDLLTPGSIPGSIKERRQPVLIFGEPGLNKDNLAALIHFGSLHKSQPMIRVNCEKLRSQDLFGRGESQPGLLEWLGEGTLLLNNVQDLADELRPAVLQLVQAGNYRPVSREGEELLPLQKSSAWILMVAEKTMSELSRCEAKQIKVPPLRVRKADIEAQINYFAQLLCRKKGLCKRRLDPAALRRLQSYDFPGNLTELENMVERAVSQSGDRAVLTEEVFWAEESSKQRFRFNLLKYSANFRQFLLSPWWPDRINYGFTLWFYPIVVAVLMWGPQTRDQNFALNFFWAWWWPLILLSFPFVGRLWCAVCPFMIYGEVAQWLSLKVWPRQLQGWPRAWAERWGGWILYGGFALILLWEELWNLENVAYLSGWLLLIITAGAVICSVLFERRFWCRYLCPIGGMNGLFAKLSMVELRAEQGICSASCNTYHCYKGGPAEGEGQETAGCPIYSHPAQLTDNRNCVLCMTCLKACPHQSVALNLRPPGIELWTTHSSSAYEVALLLLLLGAVLLHRLPQLTGLVLGESTVLETFGGHAIASIVVLFLPSAIALIADRVRVQFQGTGANRRFLELAYGYLPLLLFASLAHYLLLGLSEAGQLVPVFFQTWQQQATNIISPSVSLVAHPAVIAFLQAVSLLLGALLSVVLTQKIGRQSWQKLLPQHGVTVGLTLLFWQLIV
ncbi:MAG: cyclic nucleotide-binding domain-containing protein [Cyanobacteria bacterium J06650_10]